jgi:hypothetical protein
MSYRIFGLLLGCILISFLAAGQHLGKMPTESVVIATKIKKVSCAKNGSIVGERQYDSSGRIIEERGVMYAFSERYRMTYSESGELIRKQMLSDARSIDLSRKNVLNGTYIVGERQKVGDIDSMISTYRHDSLMLSRFSYRAGRVYHGFQNVYDSAGNLVKRTVFWDFEVRWLREFTYVQNNVTSGKCYRFESGKKRLQSEFEYSRENVSPLATTYCINFNSF